MKINIKTYSELHFVVFLLGFTGILGKLISLEAPHLVVFRIFIAALTLYLLLASRKTNLRISRRTLISCVAVGFVVAAHWTTFFLAIKLSNVSVGLGLLGVGTLFTALLEPIILKQKISLFDVITGVIIIAGIYIIFRFEARYIEGIIVAIVSYFLSSLFSVANKKMSEHTSGQVLSFYELLFGFMFAMLALPFIMPTAFESFWPEMNDFILLLILGSICTAYAFTAAIRLMKELSAYFVVLHINLEPVYAIILAFLIFGDSEYMSSGFYIGASLIFLSVALYPILKYKLKRTYIKKH